MAANFWDSTQRRHWTFTKDQLASMRQQLENSDPGLVQMYPLPNTRHLGIFFHSQVNRLGKRLGVRQQAMATAQVYLKRFFTKVDIRRTNPYLMIATSVYLACKMEECPQHIRLIVTEARSLWPDFLGLIDTSKLGECEFFLISEMHSQLIIHQPYRTLTNLQSEFALSQEEAKFAWEIINDHYMTDLPLLHPPHVIALTATLLSLVLKSNNTLGLSAAHMAAAAMALAQGGRLVGLGNDSSRDGLSPSGTKPDRIQRFSQWLAESNVDIEAMVDCTQEMIALYETMDQLDEKNLKDAVNRYIKARGLDK